MRRIARAALVGAALAALAAPVRASSSTAGTAAGQFLTLDVDARAVAMGEAYGALAGDASAVYWNPADLARMKDPYLTFTHTIYLQSVYYDFVAYAQPIRLFWSMENKSEVASEKYGTLGVGLLYLNAGSLSTIDNTGTANGGSITPSDYAGYVSWGVPIGLFDLGMSLKYVSSTIQDSATTATADVGARMHVPIPGAPLLLAFAGQNLFGSLKFIDESFDLPRLFRFSAAMLPLRDLTLAAEVDASNYDSTSFGLGAEYRVALGKTWGVAARMGYNSATAGNALEKTTGVTAGAGLRLSNMYIDYAWVPYGVLGSTNRFTLGYKF